MSVNVDHALSVWAWNVENTTYCSHVIREAFLEKVCIIHIAYV